MITYRFRVRINNTWRWLEATGRNPQDAKNMLHAKYSGIQQIANYDPV